MRRSREVVIAPIEGRENRDAGKRFLITEMSAVAGEAWAIRALGAMVRGGIEIPPEVAKAGMGGLAIMFPLVGAKAFLSAPFEETKPLLDQLLDCVQIVEPAITRRLLDTDIEEIMTLVRLRNEAIELHTGFSPAAASPT